MLYLLTEEAYKSYPWCRRGVRGLWEEARKKRVPLQELDCLQGIPPGQPGAAVLLLGASEAWLREQVQQAGALGVHPIVLSNCQVGALDGPMSLVTMDLRNSMRLAVDYLQSLGCRRLALYGCNPHSSSDRIREQAFRPLAGPDAPVFYNWDSLQSAFESFWALRERAQGVICASDYAALSLVRHLRQKGLAQEEWPLLIGYGDLTLSRMSSPSITSISDDYEHFGRAGLAAYHLVVKERTVSAVHIQLHSQLHIRQTTRGLPYRPGAVRPPAAPQAENPFFQDEEITRMARAENLLNQCDEVDFSVLRCLLAGETYAGIAQQCYISETAVKYRIKKMEQAAGAAGREALAAFLREYLG